MTTERTPNNCTLPALQQSRLKLGRLGLADRLQRRVLTFRATLERLVLDRHQEIDALTAKRIASACLALAEALRAQSRLADAEASKLTLTEEQVMGWSDRVGRNHDRCDRILAQLGIDRRVLDPQERLVQGFLAAKAKADERARLEAAQAGDRPEEGKP